MDISVIVVTYNQETTIARTLDSILSQRVGADVEVIVGDDCSTDGTETICRDYASRFPGRIIYLRREANMGVVGNYFDCVRRARGEFLADCAGDDFWTDPLKLQKQLDRLRSRPGVTMVATDFLCRDVNTGALSRHPHAPAPAGIETFARGQLFVPMLAQRRLIHLCTAMWHRQPLLDAMAAEPECFTDPAFTTEDLQIVLAMNAVGEIDVLPDITLNYSIGHASISHQPSFARQLAYSLRSVAQTRRLQMWLGVSDDDLRANYTRLLDHMAAMAFRAGDAKLLRKFDDFRREMPFAPGPKGKAYVALTRNSLVWKAARHLIPQIHG